MNAATESGKVTVTQPSNRRSWLCAAGLGAAAPLLSHPGSARGDGVEGAASARPQICLNTGTIRGHKLPLDGQIEVAIQAGYRGIEPWISDLEKFEASGGRLADLAKRLADAGLTTPSAIGFAKWIVDDPQQRREALEQARRDMARVRALGGTRIAAPPAGAVATEVDLDAAAERYAELLQVGANEGVTPQLELWGFSRTLRRIGELLYVAAEAGRPDACVLPDVYHIYKGGSSFAGLGLVASSAVHVFHINDYPKMPRSEIQDRDRVFPGDGIAPLNDILTRLKAGGFSGALSLELFNPEYWRMPALEAAKTGLRKTQQCVDAVWT